MRAIVQRVTSASVAVENTTVGAIDRGLMVLVGLTHDDTERDMDHIVNKVLSLRLFENDAGKPWARSVRDIDGGVLCVSQVGIWLEIPSISRAVSWLLPC